MQKIYGALGIGIAFLMTALLASPTLACDGDKKDKKDDSVTVTMESTDVLACDGDKKDKKDDSFAA